MLPAQQPAFGALLAFEPLSGRVPEAPPSGGHWPNGVPGGMHIVLKRPGHWPMPGGMHVVLKRPGNWPNGVIEKNKQIPSLELPLVNLESPRRESHGEFNFAGEV